MKFLFLILLLPLFTKAQDISYRDVPEASYHTQRKAIVKLIRSRRDSIYKKEPKYTDSVLKYIPPNGNLADTDGTQYGFFIRAKREQIEEIRREVAPLKYLLWKLNHTFYTNRTIIGDRNENFEVWVDPGNEPVVKPRVVKKKIVKKKVPVKKK